ncbi:hypothetical protein ABEW05_008665 [Botrytis cinerea]
MDYSSIHEFRPSFSSPNLSSSPPRDQSPPSTPPSTPPPRKHRRKHKHKASFLKTVYKWCLNHCCIRIISMIPTLLGLMVFIFWFQRPLHLLVDTTVLVSKGILCISTPFECTRAGAGWLGFSLAKTKSGGHGNGDWNRNRENNKDNEEFYYYTFSPTPTHKHHGYESQSTSAYTTTQSTNYCENILNLEQQFFIVNSPALFSTSSFNPSCPLIFYQNTKLEDLDIRSEVNSFIQLLDSTLKYLPSSTSTSTHSFSSLKKFHKILIELGLIFGERDNTAILYFDSYINTTQNLQHITSDNIQTSISVLATVDSVMWRWKDKKCEDKGWLNRKACNDMEREMRKEMQIMQTGWAKYFAEMRGGVDRMIGGGRKLEGLVAREMQKGKQILNMEKMVKGELSGESIRKAIGEMVWRDLMGRLDGIFSCKEGALGGETFLTSGQKTVQFATRLKKQVAEIKELRDKWYILPLGKEAGCFFPEIWGGMEWKGVGEWIEMISEWYKRREKFMGNVERRLGSLLGVFDVEGEGGAIWDD